ncbi:hypothetical protein [Deinococcus sp. QL22]|uniref:hypothetical protein n=1 Tax=Deinococcus sp. QL22 TaxID=2939437 RepID=UPI0020181C83|nr:hypothetical protein [Deinococcus sp. QL22]UQN10655.1 hypothetical protein M1R55_30230 [Deinococcus sp. QL22]
MRQTTYEDLLGSKNFVRDTEAGSIVSYRSTFKNLLHERNVPVNSVVSSIKLRELFNSTQGSTRSIVVYFYKLFVHMFLNTAPTYISLIEVISQGIAKGKLNSALPEELRTPALLSKFIAESNYDDLELETSLYLPINSLKTLRAASKSGNSIIPDHWWKIPDNISQVEKRRIREEAETLYSREAARYKDSERQLVFENILRDCIERKHYTGYYFKINAYKKSIGFSTHVMSPENLREYQEFTEFKLSFISYGKIKNWDVNKSSAENHKTELISYYSYFKNIHKIKKGEPEWNHELHLGLFALADHVIAAITLWKDVKGNFDDGSLTKVNFAIALLHAEDGWVARNESYKSRLPIPIQEEIDRIGGWVEFCAKSKALLMKFSKHVARLKRPSRDSQEHISALLDKEAPLKFIFSALDFSLHEIKSRYDQGQRDKKFVLDAQRHVFLFMLSCFPLRAGNWINMRFMAPSGTTGIRRSSTGNLSIHVKVSELKNSNSNYNLRNQTEIACYIGDYVEFTEHINFMEVFFTELRPLINSTDLIFCDKNGNSLTVQKMSNLCDHWTKKFISHRSIYGSSIPGLPSFRAHAMRHVVATHYVQQGKIGMAAALLCDTEYSIIKNYVRDTFDSRIGRALRETASLISKFRIN